MAKRKRTLVAPSDIDKKAGALSRRDFDRNRKVYLAKDLRISQRNRRGSLIFGVVFTGLFLVLELLGISAGFFLVMGIVGFIFTFVYQNKVKSAKLLMEDWGFKALDKSKEEENDQQGNEEQYF